MPSTQVVGGADALGLANWIQNQFSGTTYQPNAMDVQHEPLYDRSWNSATNAPWAAGATIPNLTQFFTTGNQTGKTLADTNVATAKRLDAPQAFAAMGIGLWFAGNILLADLNTIFNSFALEFWIGEKSYNRAPLWFYSPGAGVYGFSSANTAYVNGLPAKSHRHELAINIVIDNQASFYCQLVGSSVTLTSSTNSGTGANLMVILDGLHARGVQ